MRRKNLTILILIILVTIVGCKPTAGQEEIVMDMEANDFNPTLRDYFPFMENTIYKYEGIGNEFAEMEAYFEYIEGNKAQLKIKTPATNFVRVLEHKEGILKEVYFEGEFYHVENMLGHMEEQDNIVLKEPIEVGNSWTTANGYKRSISGIEVEVETPLKTFKALEVTTELGDGRLQKHYYAKDVGLVASIYEDGEHVVKSLLKSIENGSMELNLKTFYPLLPDMEAVYVEDTIDFYTNGRIEGLLEEILKNPPDDDLIAVIPAATTINYIKLDRSNWSVKVDFSQDFIREMNAGSGLEGEILRCIANTLGHFYDVERIYITVDEKPYQSGHYAFEADEFIRVDMEGIVEYEKK